MEDNNSTYELAMDITTDGNWTSHRLYIRLFHQDLPGLHGGISLDQGMKRQGGLKSNLVAEFFNIVLCELFTLT